MAVARICFHALLTIFVLVCVAEARETRVLNLDFGNGSTYVGDDGVLSSPGGTHWNPVGDDYYNATPFLDEFGQSFDLPYILGGGQLPNLWFPHGGPLSGEMVAGSGQGPLSDGWRHIGDAGEPLLGIREFLVKSRIDIIIYFEPLNHALDNIANGPYGLNLNYGEFTQFALPPSGSLSFPGVEGRDYLRFDNLTPHPTTIGSPPLHGVNLFLPGSILDPHAPSSITISAIQIRGEFTATPEPCSLALSAFGVLVLLHRQRT